METKLFLLLVLTELRDVLKEVAGERLERVEERREVVCGREDRTRELVVQGDGHLGGEQLEVFVRVKDDRLLEVVQDAVKELFGEEKRPATCDLSSRLELLLLLESTHLMRDERLVAIETLHRLEHLTDDDGLHVGHRLVDLFLKRLFSIFIDHLVDTSDSFGRVGLGTLVLAVALGLVVCVVACRLRNRGPLVVDEPIKEHLELEAGPLDQWKVRLIKDAHKASEDAEGLDRRIPKVFGGDHGDQKLTDVSEPSVRSACLCFLFDG
mmetsp:Transcript_10964/g.18577  ORF Transcript_10964/g.18577 Transcript_10964/m.18577 type:complete len:267 (+) Transcript_10964:365-1165(+)